MDVLRTLAQRDLAISLRDGRRATGLTLSELRSRLLEDHEITVTTGFLSRIETPDSRTGKKPGRRLFEALMSVYEYDESALVVEESVVAWDEVEGVLARYRASSPAVRTRMLARWDRELARETPVSDPPSERS